MADASPDVQPRRWFYPLQVLVLAGLPLIAYIPSFNSSFHLDDWPIALDNHFIRISILSLKSLAKAAFQDFGNNRPLVNLSLALNFYFNDEIPLAYHLVNFIVLVFTAFGIWLVLQKLLKRLGFDASAANFAAWSVALIWACHPVNVQAITYVIQRYASMAGMFSIWSIAFFHLGWERERRRAPYLALGFILCLAALTSKESAATLPAVIFLYKILFFDKLSPGWLRKNLIWIAALVVFYGLASAVVLRPSMAKIVFNFARQPFTARQRVLTEPRVLLWYPLLIAFPFPQFLSLLHTFEISKSVLEPEAILSFLAILALILLAILGMRKWKVLSFAIFWYFGQLLVEALPLPIELAHEHRLYLASLSIIAPAVAWPVLRFKSRNTALFLIVVVAIFFTFFTWSRNNVFESEQTFWRDPVTKAPDFSSLAWRIYCLTRIKQGDCFYAIPICRKAEEIGPDNIIIINNLGACYLKTGKIRQAQEEFLLADSMEPDNPQIAFNLGLAFSAQKNYEEAAKWFRAVIAKQPADAKAHAYLAMCLFALKDEQGYLDELRQALAIDPYYAEVRAELAMDMAKKGNCDQALELLDQAPQMDARFNQVARFCESRKK